MTSSRKKLPSLLTALALIFAVGLGWMLFPDREPKYNGLTLEEWLERNDAPENNGEVRHAVIAIGVDHLSLLTGRIADDPTDCFSRKLLRKLSRRFTPRRVMNGLQERIASKISLGNDSVEAFKILGPLGAPAIPQLTEILNKGGHVPASRALQALASIGAPAVPALLSTAADAHHPMRVLAIDALAARPNSPSVIALLSEAQKDPEPAIRAIAARALDGHSDR